MSNPNQEIKCDTCVYSKWHKDSFFFFQDWVLRCHRWSPDSDKRFPAVKADDWCGEYEPMAKPSEEKT